jgi:flagellar L-ring protein precursor FlgH
MRPIYLTAFAVLAMPIAACTTVSEAVRGPQLTPMVYPAVLVPTQPNVVQDAYGRTPQPASANSLWRAGARAFFIDQRARRVGDILTVNIEIDDSAATSNASSSSRSSSTGVGVNNFLGIESSLGKVFPEAIDPSNLINTDSGTNNAGTGTVNRQERISLTIAAVVTQVLPNGNLVISGTQEVRTNNEVRHLSVDGIVRPEDITAANTISHSQIASARIDYGGRGDQSRVQKTPSGQSLVERFSPF